MNKAQKRAEDVHVAEMAEWAGMEPPMSSEVFQSLRTNTVVVSTAPLYAPIQSEGDPMFLLAIVCWISAGFCCLAGACFTIGFLGFVLGAWR